MPLRYTNHPKLSQALLTLMFREQGQNGEQKWTKQMAGLVERLKLFNPPPSKCHLSKDVLVFYLRIKTAVTH